MREQVFPCPPLEEQKIIIKILDLAHNMRVKRSQILTMTAQLLQSVFFKIFGRISTNSMRWDFLSLNDACETIYRYPTFYGFKYTDNGIPVVKIGDIQKDGRLKENLQDYSFISKEVVVFLEPW